ncbi:hypothetical protein [uncultured archaeal virus]|uniref:Uncharacterized protein n=1 Tax=uncultured archaeal virus TaxID=1960247 RepID=A0A8B0LPY0_9VIRU|nr:hypothetical protein [uncultured archaeal virus]
MTKSDWMTATEIENALKTGIKNAKNAFENGIDNCRRDPIKTAIAAITSGKWEKNFKDSSEKWEKNLSKISLEDWKKATIAGASRYADNAADIGSEEWGKYYTSAKSTIEAASSELIASKQEKADFIKFYEAMSKLKNID